MDLLIDGNIYPLMFPPLMQNLGDSQLPHCLLTQSSVRIGVPGAYTAVKCRDHARRDNSGMS